MSTRNTKVKNKEAADIQITAEQLLREANERRDAVAKPPKQKITDQEELADHRQRKRKGFEDLIRKDRFRIGTWIKYAAWEESQKEIERARSVYERALDADPRNVTLYIRYAEMEMKHKMINHARNILDRAVSLLPRIDQIWYKFTYMEELLGNVAGTRQVFERWMQWEPDESAWMSYIKLEKRYKEFDRARQIFARFVQVHPEPKNWLKYAKFEEHYGRPDDTRNVFNQAIEVLGLDHIDEQVLIAFGRFEASQKEFERARVIYKYALDNLPKSKTEKLYKAYSQFEKQHGETEGIEDVILNKRRWKYEEDIKDNPRNYDTWFDYIRLEEAAENIERTREVFERAISQIPPTEEKRFWSRYIYLWINYALFEELNAKDYERTRQVYSQCLKLIPHKKFTFAKIWLLAAQFEIRMLDVSKARKTLGMALGMCPKIKLYKGYIELELQLREFDRCRLLYEKYLLHSPEHCYAWIKAAELEKMLGDIERCRAIFELAVSQTLLDMPEVLWKAFIDFEFGEEEWEKCRALYERLLKKTEHVKVWISFANFENSSMDIDDEVIRAERARITFERAYSRMRTKGLKEERVILLEAWKEFEQKHGNDSSLMKLESKMPRVVKKRRKAEETGISTENVAWEEYYDYIFPDDESQKSSFKLLSLAQEWKRKQETSKRKREDEDV